MEHPTYATRESRDQPLETGGTAAACDENCQSGVTLSGLPRIQQRTMTSCFSLERLTEPVKKPGF